MKPWPTKGVEAIAAVVWLEAFYQNECDLDESEGEEQMTREECLRFIGLFARLMDATVASGATLKCEDL